MINGKKSLELKKHVATIHSSHKLGLLQRKIANALLFNAYDELLDKDEYEIHIATLCKLIGYDSNDYKTIKKALINLLATVIEWNLVDGNKVDAEGVWNASSIIADASIDGPVCTYSYSNKMKKLLYRPELYGRLNMLVQAKFQSSYGLALYENCIRFQNIEQTPWLDILKFRKLMGVEDGKYKIFRDFKTRVLDKAVEEVNKYSPIKVTPQFRKQGRQVISIQFTIKQVRGRGVAASEETLHPVKLSDILKSRFGLSQKQVDDTMSAYDENYIQEKIQIIESSPSYNAGKISNLAKYLICALKEDYQSVKSSNITQKITKKSEFGLAHKQAEQNKVEDYRRYQQKEILKRYHLFSAKTKQTLLVEFEKHLSRGVYHVIYLRDALENILIQDQLCAFIKLTRPEMIEDILSYADYLAEQETIQETS